ncbi:MAG: sensor histidine kinase, partial [Chloroflexi bacterium]|nr:sensor histidine kinase [Chloroflexota bacterium]
ITDQLCTAFDREQTKEEAEIREAELRSLLDSEHRVGDSRTVDVVLRELAQGLVQVSSADAAIISLCEDQPHVATPVAYYAVPGVTIEHLLNPIPEFEDIDGAVIGTPQNTENIESGCSASLTFRWGIAEGWQTQLSMPLLVDGQRLGLVEVGSRDPEYRFTQRIVDSCHVVLQQAAVGIYHARLSQHAVERSTSLSGLADFSETLNNAPDDLEVVLHLICDEANRLLRTSHASLYLLRPDEQKLELQAQSGIAGPQELGTSITVDYPFSLVARAVRERRMIVDTELGRDTSGSRPSHSILPIDVGDAKSAVVAPLRHNGVTLGALLLTDRRRRKTFHSEAIGLINGLAAQAAAALARSQIRTVEHERLQIASVLGTISASIGADADPATIYGLILQESAKLITYDEASISLFSDSLLSVASSTGDSLKILPQNASTQQLWRDPEKLDLAACMRDPALARILGGARFEDLLSYPMLVNGSVVGRLTFASRLPGRYEAHQVQLSALLAERTAQVVTMVQLRAAQQAALTKLTQLDEMRQDFVATVSHELRTPLTGILGYIELLLSRWTALDDERRRGMLERTQSAATRLEHLVNDLLLFSNVEHQSLQLQISNYSLEALIDQAGEVMRTKYRGQELDITHGASPVRVQADAQRTIQVFANLLDNAIKYSPIGSLVHIRWKLHRQSVEVIVRDHGPGIEDADMPRLFTRFGTLGHQPRPGQVGTGIGLFVCKKLVEAMSGQIWVVSRPGHGTSFHVTLPRVLE